MAFSEELGERIRQGVARPKGIVEKKMFLHVSQKPCIVVSAHNIIHLAAPLKIE